MIFEASNILSSTITFDSDLDYIRFGIWSDVPICDNPWSDLIYKTRIITSSPINISLDSRNTIYDITSDTITIT